MSNTTNFMRLGLAHNDQSTTTPMGDMLALDINNNNEHNHKKRDLSGILPLRTRISWGSHRKQLSAPRASVGCVAAILLLTVLHACLSVHGRLTKKTPKKNTPAGRKPSHNATWAGNATAPGGRNLVQTVQGVDVCFN